MTPFQKEPGLDQKGLALVMLGLGFAGVWLGSTWESLRLALPVGAAIAMAALIWAWRIELFGPRWVLAVGLLLRLLFLPVPPSLSTDVYRYFWDGWVALHGINPFQYVPSDPALVDLRGVSYYGMFNSPDYYSVYPPVMQGFFLIAAWAGQLGFGWGYILLKLLLGSCELAALFVLTRLLPARQVLLYAWNPLVIVETWGQPHGEAIVLGALAGCLWFARRRPMISVGLLTIATWTKFWPMLWFPFLLRHLSWHWRHFVVAGGVTALLWAPYASVETFQHIGQSLGLYTHLLEWNAGLYELLYLVRWGITKALWTLGLLPMDMGHGRLTAPLMRWMLLVILAVLYWKGRSWPLARQLAVVSVGFLLSLSTIHPWYLLPVFFLIPFFCRVEWSWFLLALTSLGTYLAYEMGPAAYWPFAILGWLGWGAILTLQWWQGGKPPFSDPLTIERP